MEKQVPGRLGEFTPLYDSIVQEHGLIVAAVYGKVWRYCNMQERLCRASQDRIADELKITRATVNTCLKTLVTDQYLIVQKKSGTPNSYWITGKADLKMAVYVVNRIPDLTIPEMPVNQVDTYNNDEPVNVVDTTCKRSLQPPVNVVDTNRVLNIHKDTDISTEEKTPSVVRPKAPPLPVKTKKDTHLFHIAKSLAEVIGLDFDKNKGMLFRNAKVFQPGDDAIIRRVYGAEGDWYRRDWRGKKGQKPNLASIRETWQELTSMETPKATEPRTEKMIMLNQIDGKYHEWDRREGKLVDLGPIVEATS